MKTEILDIEKLKNKIATFAKERDWEQFHNPKNLCMALSVEAAELMEIFQWLTPEQANNIHNDEKKCTMARDELADIMLYTIRMAHILEIDIPSAIESKIIKNGEKYPISKSKGNAKKYNE